MKIYLDSLYSQVQLQRSESSQERTSVLYQSRSDSRVSVVHPYVYNAISIHASRVIKSSIKIRHQNQASKLSVKIKRQNQASKSSVKIEHQYQASSIVLNIASRLS